MRKRSSKGGGAQRSIQVHLMVNEEEAAMIRAAARKRNQTVSLTIIEAVKLLEGRLQVEEEEHDSPTVQALRDIEYQLRRIGRNVNQLVVLANMGKIQEVRLGETLEALGRIYHQLRELTEQEHR